MVNLTVTAQLDLVDTIETLIKADSILKVKFKSSNIYNFEPDLKNITSTGVPFIVIKYPEISTTDTDSQTIKRESRNKPFSVKIELVIDYDIAKTGKLKEYLNRLLWLLESSVSTFRTAGYSEIDVTVDSVEPDILDSEQRVVRAIIGFECKGIVEY
jgi:hypothetical protein